MSTELLRPRRLHAGDRIGIVTPSWPVSRSPSGDPFAELERGLGVLRDLGFEPVMAPNALAVTGYMAGPAHDRAADINSMFADPSIAALIASHGGQVAMGILGHLDWETIRAHPKVFMGFSNIALLNLAILARAGVVAFHGNTVIWHLGMNPSPYDLAELKAVLVDGRTGTVPKRSAWTTVRDGRVAEGRLIGEGSALRALAGTPYQLEIDEDVILFFEGIADPPGVTDTMLHVLDYIGVFERTRGVLVGNDGAAYTGHPPEVPFVDILLDIAGRYDFPIIKCDDFGHASPNTVLPVGIRARLDPRTATLELLEPAVI